VFVWQPECQANNVTTGVQSDHLLSKKVDNFWTPCISTENTGQNLRMGGRNWTTNCCELKNVFLFFVRQFIIITAAVTLLTVVFQLMLG